MTIQVSEEVKSLLMLSACNALPSHYWKWLTTYDQKAHYIEAKRSCIYLAISLDIDGDKRLQGLLSKRDVKVYKSYRNYLLSFYLLIEVIWKELFWAAKNPALVGFLNNPDGSRLTEIDFPFKSAAEITAFYVNFNAFLHFKICLEECKLFSHSRAIKMHRIDHDLRTGHRVNLLEKYETDLAFDRRGSEEFYSLKEFCERVAKKFATKDRDVNQVFQTYRSQCEELDKIAIAGQRGTKGFGFIEGQRVEPTRGGNWRNLTKS